MFHAAQRADREEPALPAGAASTRRNRTGRACAIVGDTRRSPHGRSREVTEGHLGNGRCAESAASGRPLLFKPNSLVVSGGSAPPRTTRPADPVDVDPSESLGAWTFSDGACQPAPARCGGRPRRGAAKRRRGSRASGAGCRRGPQDDRRPAGPGLAGLAGRPGRPGQIGQGPRKPASAARRS